MEELDNNIDQLDDMISFEDEDNDFTDLAEMFDETEGNTEDDSSGIDPTDELDAAQSEDEDPVIEDDSPEDSVEPDPTPEPEEGDDDEDEGTDDGNDSSISEAGDLTSYYNFLKQTGLILVGDDYEFDGSPEKFQEVIESTRSNMQTAGAQMIWEQLPDSYKLVLEHGLNGGNDINAVKEVINGQTDLDSLDLEDEGTQENLMVNYLKRTTKYDDNKIQKAIARIKATGDLEEEAESALSELKGIYREEKEALVRQQAEEQQKAVQTQQESYNNFLHTVGDMKMPDDRKRKIVSSIWTVGDYGEYENVSYFNYIDYIVKNNPEHLAQLAEIYLDYDSQKGFTSDTIKRKVKSEVTTNFRDSIDLLTKTKSRTKQGKSTKRKSSQSDLDALQTFLSQN